MARFSLGRSGAATWDVYDRRRGRARKHGQAPPGLLSYNREGAALAPGCVNRQRSEGLPMPSDPAPNQTPPPTGKPRRRPTNPSMGGNWIWLLMLCLAAVVIYSSMKGASNTITYSDFLELLQKDNVKEVAQNGDRYEGEIKDPSKLSDELKKKLGPTPRFNLERLAGNDLPLQQMLTEKAAKGLIVYAKPTYSWLSPLLMLMLPAVLILA